MMHKISISTAGAIILAPQACYAHIKWFCAYDTTIAPLPMHDVLSPTFVVTAMCFAGLMFLTYLLDSIVDRRRWLAGVEQVVLRGAPLIPVFIRIAVGVFFLVLWIDGGTILTPELTTTSTWVPWLQLAIAVSTLWRSALVFTAVGIITLYVLAVSQYGAFHMMDYPVFLGVAAYLGLSAAEHPFLLRLRLPALYFNVVVTMMWGAIEKFGYPYWTFPLLSTHVALTFGIPFQTFMVIAGFVELSLAFFMVTGTALLRLSCLALLTLLVSAIPEFGQADAVGHFLIIAALLVMIIAGQDGIGLPVMLRPGGVVAKSCLLTLTYGLTISALFAAYYSAQFVAGR